MELSNTQAKTIQNLEITLKANVKELKCKFYVYFRENNEQQMKHLASKEHCDKFEEEITPIVKELKAEVSLCKLMQTKIDNFLEKYLVFEMRKMINEVINNYVNPCKSNNETIIYEQNKIYFYLQSILKDTGETSIVFLNKIRAEIDKKFAESNISLNQKLKENDNDDQAELDNTERTNKKRSQLLFNKQSHLEGNENNELKNLESFNQIQLIELIKKCNQELKPIEFDYDFVSCQISNIKQIIKDEFESKLTNISQIMDLCRNEIFEKFNLLHTELERERKGRIDDCEKFVK